MPPKSSAKKKGEGKQAATAAEGAEGFEDHSDHEDPSVSSKESDSAAESARILDEAMDLMTSNAAQAQQHFMPYGGITPQMMAAALHAQSNMSGAVSQSSFQPSSQEDAQKQLAQSSASSGDSLWGGGGFFK